MNKTWQLRVCALYLTVGLPLAASCAREANTLEDGEPSGSAGKASAGAGSSSKAGSGSGTAGTTGAFGGTSGKAGAGAGGKTTGEAGEATAEGGDAPSAGTAGSGTAGSGGASGAGGSTTVPPDVLARAGAIVHYQTSHVAASDGTIQMKLNITNQSDDPLPMASVKIRYWCTAEVVPELHQYYTGPQARPAMAAFVNDGANSHALMTFGAGVIAKGGQISDSEVQLVLTNNTGKFNQADDFSWEPSSTTSTPNGKITLYLADKLIWGCEPSGACFDDAGAGGAGGAGGMTGAGGAP